MSIYQHTQFYHPKPLDFGEIAEKKDKTGSN